MCIVNTLYNFNTLYCQHNPSPLATVPLRRLAFYSSSPVMLVAFEVTKNVIAETGGGITPRDVSFRNHVPYALVYSLNKFARVSLYILFFFGVHFLFFLTYT